MSQVDPSMLLLQMQSSPGQKRTLEPAMDKAATQSGKSPSNPWRDLLGEQHAQATSRQETDPGSTQLLSTNADGSEMNDESSSSLQTVTTQEIHAPASNSRHETGIEKLVPMHLHATGHLAYQANAQGVDASVNRSGGATGRQAVNFNSPNYGEVSKAPQRADAGHSGTNISTPGNAQAMSAPRKALEILRGVVESSGTANRNADSEWLARRFQIIERDGQLHVRIRDYQLDTETQLKITESLLAHAHANGREVNRVLINGRLMWADGNLLINEQGERHAD